MIHPATAAPAPGQVSAPTAGPVALAKPARLHPIADVAISGGLWNDLQLLNSRVTIREAFRQLEEAGNLNNFRVAAGERLGSYQGRLYLDSDVYKTLEAVAWEQGRAPAQELADWQDKVTALIGRAQRPDGYLNTFVQVTTGDTARYADLPGGHELFCGGHLIQAGVAQARATGRSELLEIARRYADHLVATFGPGRLESTDGHPEIEMALVELYRETGTQAYLDLASFLVDVRGHGVLGNGWLGSAYYQDELPARAAHHVRGHAVRQVFLSAGITDLSLETGDRDLLTASVAQWEDMVTTKTYLTGGIGARWEGEAFGNPFELPPDVAYAETCAAHGSILWSWRLLLATGHPRYADLIERTLYNGFASGLSLDGARFFYVNALQNRPGSADDSGRAASHGRQPWYGTACCPPNVMRTLASLQHYIATSDDDGLQVQQYVSGHVAVDLPAGHVQLRTSTNLPWNGQVEIVIEEAPADPWTLSLRIPSWAVNATLTLNGTAIGTNPEPGTYLRMRDRPWRPGDTLRLTLPCVPRLTRADPRIDAVHGMVAIERGPLVYAFEALDQPSGVDLGSVELRTDLLLVEEPRPDLLGGTVTIHAQARLVPTPGDATAFPYTAVTDQLRPHPHLDLHADLDAEVQLTAVPYFRWANRELGPMRVFLPTTTPSVTVAEENQ